ncbi:MAG TPA: methyltransferase domain-containing protein [candidate division Zixibacteria bacterium]|nr:methyltransferase domain-containing protein [candidate division Zixibacteria bacterium]
MNKFTPQELFDILVKDAEHPFSGWDFSFIQHRIVDAPLSWSYHSKILPYVRTVKTMLDMGTGGGEFLSLLQPLPKFTYATEAYKPNVSIARKKLEPIGVKVFEIDDMTKLPFKNDQFELIINRHEEYSPSELFRILEPEGYFITQQVGGKNDFEINQSLGAKLDEDYLDWNLDYAINELEGVGLKIIEKKEDLTYTRCYDIGALIYHLKAIPWQIADFSIEKYLDKLKILHSKTQEDGYFDITNHRFFIKAKREK